MENRTKKKILACIISFVILAGVIILADILFKEITVHGVKQGLAFYDQPEDSIDVLVLGSSHVHYGVNTAKLWEDYGISAYDYSSAEQALWVSYYYLIEACKTQKPKVVVLDFFSPAAFQDDHKYKYAYLSDTLYGIRFSFNKLRLMYACFDHKLDLWNTYFPGFFGYHDQYQNMESADFARLFADYEDFKGFTPYFEYYPISPNSIGTDEVLPPSQKSQKYLKKILDYTKKHDIELYITIVPYNVNQEQVTDVVQEEDKRYNWLEQYIAERREEGYENVYFDYTLRHMESFDLHMGDGEDMYDDSHLNYYGSCKFTDYLGKDLLERYGADLIPDHREDPYYSSWDRNVEIIRQDVESHGFEWR
jgi:hypothetical protein